MTDIVERLRTAPSHRYLVATSDLLLDAANEISSSRKALAPFAAASLRIDSKTPYNSKQFDGVAIWVGNDKIGFTWLRKGDLSLARDATAIHGEE